MELEEHRPLKSLDRDELAFFSLGLFRNFGLTIHPFAHEPDFFGIYNEPHPLPYGDLLPSSTTVIEAWHHCEKLFSEAS